MKTSGTLYRDITGEYFFRVYTKNSDEGFIDYSISACDIAITINDPSVCMKKGFDNEPTIDYTDSVLGRE